ncbi:MAG: ribbon-helix-helix protein, CopG family [Synergistaceae bacterium]|jgi:RHH-type rel operon transcriptional repressor/antitoxin RelB|nr:ribbon-helix-helix protein, CopG family [Synergistaceae bacterium]
MPAVRIPEDLDNRLNTLARRTGRSKNSFVREALLRQLDDIEDYYLGMETLERIRNGEERVYSAAEARRELGLND